MMNARDVASALGGLLAVAASALSVLIVRLLVMDPARVADAAGERGIAPLFQTIVGAILQAMSALVRYL
jgi:hypothetical protein